MENSGSQTQSKLGQKLRNAFSGGSDQHQQTIQHRPKPQTPTTSAHDGGGPVVRHVSDNENIARPRENEYPTSFIPEVRWCYDYKSFVNRFSEEEGSYAIEALEAGATVAKEWVDEFNFRRDLEIPGFEYEDIGDPPTLRLKKTTDTWIQRVRIQSPALLETFERVTNYTWSKRPHVFTRPFRYFIHFHNDFKKELQRMEAEFTKFYSSVSNDNQMLARQSTSTLGDTSNGISAEDRRNNAKYALDDMRCYLGFIETHILPLYSMFKSAHATSAETSKVRFSDLWYLFRPGELVYAPAASLKRIIEGLVHSDGHGISTSQRKVGFRKQSTLRQKFWRLHHTEPAADRDDEMPVIIRDDMSENRRFLLKCYHLDFDGSCFAPVPLTLDIPAFEGEKDIKSLDFFPVRFARNHETEVREAQGLGQKYTECLIQRPMSYNGWSITTNSFGVFLKDDDGEKLTLPRLIDGNIVVDFGQCFQWLPHLKPPFTDDAPWDDRVMDSTTESSEPLCTWSDHARDDTNMVSFLEETTVFDDHIDTHEHDGAFARDAYLDPKRRSSHSPAGDDLALLPPRIFAYALRERGFFQLAVEDVRSIPSQAGVFDQLELPQSYKRMLAALIDSHLEKKRIEEYGEITGQDFIQGKGKGLVVMLHGEPGVGKTATAEAVAQKYGLPLFSITCGDLGSQPQEVEKALMSIFHLAHLWKCILLLDEADIFLTARSATDLKRNGIVTVFLRVMEYYNGILFMTTNRIGKMDAAITSRIHLTLRYKRFNISQVRKVFELNIMKLKEIEEQRYKAQQSADSKDPVPARLRIDEAEIIRFADEHYAKNDKSTDTSVWNGRQIRNAFLVASALARSEATRSNHHSDDNSTAPGHASWVELRACHFREYEQITSDFDRFRAHLLGGDESTIARKREDRDDNWDEGAEHKPWQPPHLPDNKRNILLNGSAMSHIVRSSTLPTPMNSRPGPRPLQEQYGQYGHHSQHSHGHGSSTSSFLNPAVEPTAPPTYLQSHTPSMMDEQQHGASSLSPRRTDYQDSWGSHDSTARRG